MIGSNATFDVGNLLLTTLDPAFDPQTGEFFANNTYRLTQAVTPGSTIAILPGAQINALNEGSYVAMAAPRIEQGGTVRSEEHTSELQSLLRISYAVFCLNKKNNKTYN